MGPHVHGRRPPLQHDDPAARAARAHRARPRAPLRLRPDDVRPRARRPRAHVRRVRRARALPPRARAPGHVRAQRHRRRRQDPQARAPSAARRRSTFSRACRASTPTSSRAIGCLDAGRRAARQRDTSPEIVALIEELVAKGAAYVARDAQGQRRLLRRPRASPATASSRTATSTTCVAGARVERARSSATRSTSRCGRRASRRRLGLGQPVGKGPARLAHRVLGDGARRSSARTSTSTAAGWTSSSRTTRTRSRRARPPGARRSRASGCTTASSTSTPRR